MISIKKYTFLFAFALLASNSATVCADVADERSASARRCNLAHTEFDNKLAARSRSCHKSPSTDVSWKAWLIGDSRSNQFHYLDLLELLFRDDQGSESHPTVYE